MHDIRFIRENRDAFVEGLRHRGLEAPEALADRLIALDDARREAISLSQKMQEEKNRISKEIGQAKAQGDEALFKELMARRENLDRDIGRAGAEVADKRAQELREPLAEIPNLPKPPPEVPVGKDEHDNLPKSHFAGTQPKRESGKEHFELGEAMGLMDFEAAAKLSGSRFVVLRGELARLERA